MNDDKYTRATRDNHLPSDRAPMDALRIRSSLDTIVLDNPQLYLNGGRLQCITRHQRSRSIFRRYKDRYCNDRRSNCHLNAPSNIHRIIETGEQKFQR